MKIFAQFDCRALAALHEIGEESDGKCRKQSDQELNCITCRRWSEALHPFSQREDHHLNDRELRRRDGQRRVQHTRHARPAESAEDPRGAECEQHGNGALQRRKQIRVVTVGLIASGQDVGESVPDNRRGNRRQVPGEAAPSHVVSVPRAVKAPSKRAPTLDGENVERARPITVLGVFAYVAFLNS